MIIRKAPAAAVFISAICMSAACPVGAATVVMDMEDLPVGAIQVNNLTTKGFNLSPRCHFDIFSFPSYLSSTGVALGFDSSGCFGPQPPAPSPPSFNPSYLGASIPLASNDLVYIDRNGGLFDFLSLNHVGEQISVRSSKGGFVTFGFGNVDWSIVRTLSGGDWTDVSWISISGGGGGLPSSPIDNLTFNVTSTVPTPASWGLVALALGVLATTRKHQTLQRRSSRQSWPLMPAAVS